MRRCALLVAASLALGTIAMPASAPPAGAITDIQVDLPTTTFASVVVDGARDASSSVPAQMGLLSSSSDWLGQPTGPIDDSPGASGMVIVGESLYVAAYNASTIDAYDLADGDTLIDSYDTSSLGAPKDLVWAGGMLWFTTGGCVQLGSVGSPSVTTGGVSTFTDPDHYGSHPCPVALWSYRHRRLSPSGDRLTRVMVDQNSTT
jgi:hypothetical protein